MRRKIIAVILIGGIFFFLNSCAGIREKKEKQQKIAESHYNMGVLHLNDGDYLKALLEFRKAEVLQPENAKIHNSMGLVYFFTERFEQAEEEYKKAVLLKKDYSEAYVNLGTLYGRQERFFEAIVEYRKALENPFYTTPAMAYHNIGRAYLKMEDVEEAEQAFNSAIQHDPKMIRPYFDLGKLYYQSNRMEKAIHVFSQAIQRHPEAGTNPTNTMSLAHLHYWLALSYFKNSDRGNAVTHFKEVTSLAGKSQLSEEAWKYLDLLN